MKPSFVTNVTFWPEIRGQPSWSSGCLATMRHQAAALFAMLVATEAGAFLLPLGVSHMPGRVRVVVCGAVTSARRKECMNVQCSALLEARGNPVLDDVKAASGRRDFLAVIQRYIGASAVLLLAAQGARAEQLAPGESAGEGVGDNIRKAAGKIPGMGPPDVAYPNGMLGRWRVKRLLADVDFPQGQSEAEATLADQMLSRKGTVDAFTTRFIPGKNGVVSDRGFNMRSLTSVCEGADVDVQWKATNPNVLTVNYPTGALRETKVISPSSVASLQRRNTASVPTNIASLPQHCCRLFTLTFAIQFNHHQTHHNAGIHRD